MKKLMTVVVAVVAVCGFAGSCLFVMARIGSTGTPTTTTPTPTAANPSPSTLPPPVRASAGAGTEMRAAASAALPSKWQALAGTASTMDGSTLTGFGVAADAPITDWLGRPHVPNLYVRCQGKKTDVVIHTGTSAQPELGAYNSARVRVRFDDGPIERQTWSESTNNEAYFAPSGPAFARRLAKAKRLRWGFNAFRRGEEVGDFDVRGFDALIGTVATQCGWKP